MSARRVVITGLGPVTPIGVGAGDFWNALLERRSGIRRLRAFDPARFSSQIGGEIEGVSVADCVPKSYRKAAKIMARDIVLAVVAAHQAVTDAGLRTRCLIERGEAEGQPNLDRTRFGANIGSGLICADLPELAEALYQARDNGGFSFARWGTEGMSNLTPLWLLKFLPNMLACHVTIVHDCQAPSNTITCGEASSHLAIGEAFRTIERGAADVCICGGAESKINPMSLIRQTLMGHLTTRHNETPARACRPFDVERSGTVISEGGGLMILEELEYAKRRGARIYAEMVGFGAAASSAHWMPAAGGPADGRPLVAALTKALQDAGARPEQIDLVNAFGVGTHAHDESEAAGWRQVLGSRAAAVPVLATKGALGNNGAGSGAIDLAITAMSVHRGIIPPSLNADHLDPACGLNVVRGDPRDYRSNLAVSAARAMCGGQTAALVMRRFQE